MGLLLRVGGDDAEHRPEHVGNRPRLSEAAVAEQNTDAIAFAGARIFGDLAELFAGAGGRVIGRSKARAGRRDAEVVQERRVVHVVERGRVVGDDRHGPGGEREDVTFTEPHARLTVLQLARTANDIGDLGRRRHVIEGESLARQNANEVRAQGWPRRRNRGAELGGEVEDRRASRAARMERGGERVEWNARDDPRADGIGRRRVFEILGLVLARVASFEANDGHGGVSDAGHADSVPSARGAKKTAPSNSVLRQGDRRSAKKSTNARTFDETFFFGG